LPLCLLAQDDVPLSILIDKAGLTKIIVESDHLTFVMHTERKHDKGEFILQQQNLSSYDKQEYQIWLTDSEIGQMKLWVSELSEIEIPHVFALKEQSSYGTAFVTTITAVFDSYQVETSWNGDHIVPTELSSHVNNFVSICETIIEQRFR